MKNLSPATNTVSRRKSPAKYDANAKPTRTSGAWKIARAVCVGLLLLGITLVPGVAPFAQKKEQPVKVTGVNSRKSNNGEVVTVSADGPLTRTQTWQDAEGFHLTLPGASPGQLKGLPRGVTVRNLGKSLEVVIAVKSGASVTVDPNSNALNLIVSGGVDTTQGAAQVEAPATNSVETARENEPPARESNRSRPHSERAFGDSRIAPSDPGARSSITAAPPGYNPYPIAASPQPAVPAGPPAALPAESPLAGATPQQPVPAAETFPVASAEPAAATLVNDETESGGLFSILFSTTGMLILLLVVLVVLVGVKRHRRRLELLEETGDLRVDRVVEAFELNETALVPVSEERQPRERRRMFRRKADKSIVKSTNIDNPGYDNRVDSEAIEKRPIAPVQPALFGAYRVDQEVGKLILGQAHRLDVLSSRAPDDRRALETSLIKAMNSPEADEDGRRRASQALEEYGFVARQCASLLLSHNAYDRASSARALGEMASQASMPFLLEALYDTESIVRIEAVTSLGSLKMPSAIGALLDMARRHPEMPAALVSRALSACSVECFDFFDTPMPDRLLLDTGDDTTYGGEITHLDPSNDMEELPTWFDNEELVEALESLRSEDPTERASAARRLSQFQVQPAVEALTSLAANDVEPNVRAAAVTSLGEIEHESVFASVIMAFADESREVRAAAARSLSRMSFDRAGAYVRLIETATPETLESVAQACIKGGMVMQAIDRLISEDRRLAYEAFSLLSLLAKTDQTEPLVDAISNHPELNTRLAVIRLLGTSGRADVATLLRHLAVRDGLPEKVRSALLEVVYKMDQTQPV